jgi:DNA polymerase III delta prime subunit
VVRLLISGGREIAFDVDDNAEDRDAASFLLGTALGILLQQRGHLVLHASAVAVNGHAVLFSGPSGAGKSTLAAALSREVHSFVTDDVCHVAFDAEDRPTVTPDGRMLKLWADALDHLSLGHAKSDAVRVGMQKYYTPPPRKIEPSALPLAAVYFLREALPSLTLGIERVNVAQAAPLLALNAYRPHLTEKMGLVKSYFFDAAKVWRHTRLFFLTRPLDFAAMPQLLRDLDLHWRSLGLLPQARGELR